MVIVSVPSPDRSPLARGTAGEDEGICAAVCRIVGAVAGTDVLDLPPLAGSVDPDALVAFVDHEPTAGHVAFEYLDYLVAVDADRTVSVYDRPGPTDCGDQDT